MIITGVGRTAVILICLLIAGISTIVFANYQRDIHQACGRISVVSQIVKTPCGRIEYAVVGNGQPVLVVHGAGGGYDQGLDLSKALIQSGFSVIAMSRFGYLRTPLPEDASAAAQADAHACLLDALNIRRAAVVGVSAGAPSSMQFALRHPGRSGALVLLVPMTYPAYIKQKIEGSMPIQTSRVTALLLDNALRSNFLFWALPQLAPQTLIRTILATSPSVVKNASADERTRVAEVLEHLLPISQRRHGLLNDIAITSSLPRYELERITVPTLILSLADDLFGTIHGARYSAEHIPHARYVGYPSGGHLWVGHQKEVMSEIAAFLK